MDSDFIDDFIEEYKKQPCLWQAGSADFKNRKKRQEAYHKLIEVATIHGEHYNIERTKQKINNLRCAFRHQLRKFTESKNKTSGKEDTYCPKRRYFESLMFLLNEERPERAKPSELKIELVEKPAPVTKEYTTTEYTIADPEEIKETTEIVIQPQQQQQQQQLQPQQVPTQKDEIIIEPQPPPPPKDNRVHIEVQSNDEVSFLWPRINRTTKPAENSIIHMAASDIVETEARPPSACSQSSSHSTRSENASKKVKIDCSATNFEKLLSLACSKMNSTDTSDDNFAIFGKMVAYKLRSMDSQQSIIAEKLITDILLDGQMKMLSYPARNTIPYRQDGHAFVISGLNINGTTEQSTDRTQQYSTQTIQYSTGNGSQI